MEKNAISPVILLSDLKAPLNTNTPGSRPTLPIGNSTGPKIVTLFSSPAVHFAWDGLAGSSQLSRGSSSKEPLPESSASKRNERLDLFWKVISIFQCQTKAEDSGRAASTEQLYAAKSKISISPVLITETSN